jgi:hypothetical protein
VVLRLGAEVTEGGSSGFPARAYRPLVLSEALEVHDRTGESAGDALDRLDLGDH